MSTLAFSVPAAIRHRISAPAPPRIRTLEDFADLGPRTAVDQALHRLVGASNRLGTAEQNIEKDFWVCWTRAARMRPRKKRLAPCTLDIAPD
jgi:hypothetical protein